MKSIILALSMLAAIPAMAQIHYCVVGGKKILTDKPCPGAGTELRPTVNIVQAHSVPEKQSAYGSPVNGNIDGRPVYPWTAFMVFKWLLF